MVLTSLMDKFNFKIYDVWKENMTTKREHIHPLGFWDIREGVTLRWFRCSYRVVLERGDTSPTWINIRNLIYAYKLTIGVLHVGRMS